jgi:hypothetical protein
MLNKLFKIQIIFIPLFLGLTVIFFKIDNNIQLENNFFPWDSFYYKEIIKDFDFKSYQLNNTAAPFNDRILFPIVYKTFSIYTKFNLVYSASFVNLIGVYISVICFFILGFNYKISTISLLFSSIIFLSFWGGPLRYSIYSPGMSFGFEVGLISLLITLIFFSLKNNHENNILFLIIILFSFIATLQRGLVILILCFVPVIYNYITLNSKKNLSFSKLNKKNLFIKNITIFISATLALLLLKIFFQGTGEYSILKSVIKHSYFNFNIINFLSTFYIYLGPFFILIVVYFFLLKKKFFYFKRQLQKKDFLFWGIILLVSIFFSKIGGDPDRPLMWFWNIFILLSIICFNKLKILKNNFIIIFFILISLLWSRPYLPAKPPLAFSSIFIHNNFVTTNFDENLYIGLEFFKKYKKKMIETEINFGEPYNDNIHKNLKQNIFIRDGKHNLKCKNNCYPSPYLFSYKYRLNNIPIPIGYLHNQKDALIDHPLLGKSWVLYALVVQWVFINIFFYFLIRKKLIRH